MPPSPSKTDAAPTVQLTLDHDQVVDLCAQRDALAQMVKDHHSGKMGAGFNPAAFIQMAEKVLAALELILNALPAGTTTLDPAAKP